MKLNIWSERLEKTQKKKNLENVKLLMYKTIQSKKRYEAEREYESQRMDLEKKVEDIENQIEEIQKKL